jgi:hypothetical protein
LGLNLFIHLKVYSVFEITIISLAFTYWAILTALLAKNMFIILDNKFKKKKKKNKTIEIFYLYFYIILIKFTHNFNRIHR